VVGSLGLWSRCLREEGVWVGSAALNEELGHDHDQDETNEELDVLEVDDNEDQGELRQASTALKDIGHAGRMMIMSRGR